jgi:hypothetical protein
VSDALGTGFSLPTNNAVFTGGGQIGANYQFGAAVLGVEGMFDWLANQNNASAGIPVTNLVTGNPDTVNVVSQNRWLTRLISCRLAKASEVVTRSLSERPFSTSDSPEYDRGKRGYYTVQYPTGLLSPPRGEGEERNAIW